ncbi:Chemotaxis protein CheY [compost metagenome]
MAHILIVEDDPIGAEVATVICHAAGHTTVHAVDGRDALSRLEAEPFDLALVDVQMPELDGISLTLILRGMPAHAQLPVLGCTAKAGADAIAAMREAGMDDVVTKPYRNATLREAIAGVLANCAARVEAAV